VRSSSLGSRGRRSGDRECRTASIKALFFIAMSHLMPLRLSPAKIRFPRVFVGRESRSSFDDVATGGSNEMASNSDKISPLASCDISVTGGGTSTSTHRLRFAPRELVCLIEAEERAGITPRSGAAQRPLRVRIWVTGSKIERATGCQECHAL
jgi:hypothetical protein